VSVPDEAGRHGFVGIRDLDGMSAAFVHAQNLAVNHASAVEHVDEQQSDHVALLPFAENDALQTKCDDSVDPKHSHEHCPLAVAALLGALPCGGMAAPAEPPPVETGTQSDLAKELSGEPCDVPVERQEGC